MKKVLLGSILFVSMITFVGCSSDQSATVSSMEKTITSLREENASLRGEESSSTESSEETKDSSKTYGLNEEAIIKDSSGKDQYSLKILKATTNLSETGESYTDNKVENTIEVTYEYKNIAYDKPMDISVHYLEAFDEDNKAGENMGMMDGQTEVSEGRSSESTIWFVMNKPMLSENKVEIEYVNDEVLGFKGAIKFDIPLEH